MSKPAKRNPRGWILLEDIELEGGIVVKVSLEKETGIFHARYHEHFEMRDGDASGGETWTGKDLEQIRKDVRDWAREKKALKWEPVIAIGPKQAMGMHHAQSLLGQTFQRKMRAKMHKGDGYEWREWAYMKPDKSFVDDKDLEVYPPSSQSSEPTAWGGSIDPVIMEYTPDRWLALLKLQEMEEALRRRLAEIVEAGAPELTKFLAKVPSVGLLGLSKEIKR